MKDYHILIIIGAASVVGIVFLLPRALRVDARRIFFYGQEDRPIRRRYLHAAIIAASVTFVSWITSRLLGGVQTLEYIAALAAIVTVLCLGFSNIWAQGDGL